MELFIAIAIVVIGVVVYQNFFDSTSKPPQRTPEEDERLKAEGEERLNRLRNIKQAEFKKMTVQEIVTKVGNGCEPWMVMTFLRGRKWECADHDGGMSILENRQRDDMVGKRNPRLVCPHCQEKGGVFKKLDVTRSQETRNTTNVTAAIMSGKHTTTRKVTQLHCVKCDTTWDI